MESVDTVLAQSPTRFGLNVKVCRILAPVLGVTLTFGIPRLHRRQKILMKYVLLGPAYIYMLVETSPTAFTTLGPNLTVVVRPIKRP